MYSIANSLWVRWDNAAFLARKYPLGLCSSGKSHFAYYRFHKKLGKGNWNRYIERYTKPRSIENTQNIIFNYRASFQAAKNSAAYLWELPKRIASATSSNGVLDAWIYFRHKRKKAYHFILVLKRLAEINDLDISDWRFQHIAKKLLKRSKYFIDLPNVCRYLGILKAVPTLDKLSIQLSENLESYTASQLATIAGAFGNCRLHAKHLFSLVARQLEAKIALASNQDLITISEAFGKCMVYNHGLLGSISLEMQKRLSNEFMTPDVPIELLSAPNRHCMATIKDTVVVNVVRPSMHELLRLVEAFASAKYRDILLCDLLSHMARNELEKCDHKHATDPGVVTRLLRAYSTLKVNDIPLLLSILDNVSKFPCNYPPKCIAEIGVHLCRVLPRRLDPISQKYNILLKELESHIPRMDPRQLTDTAIFAYKSQTSAGDKAMLLHRISQAMVHNRGSTVRYNAPRLLEILSMHNSLNEESFGIICRDIYRVINLFEPADYQRTARTMRKLKKDNLTNHKMINMLTKHVINHHGEFHCFQYHCVARDLTLAGPPYMPLLQDLWRHNTYRRGFSPRLGAQVTTGDT